MVSAIALHVLDESLSGFLTFYNSFVRDLKRGSGFFPAPEFSFNVWISGLIAAIIILYLLTPLVYRGGKVIRIIVIVISIIMVLNALGHSLGSIYFGEILPGFWSSPLLFLTAIMVLIFEIKSGKFQI
jgi:hypothetical protein